MQLNRHSLTEGTIWKSMLLFALPVFLSNLFQQLYNAFDTWCVGHFINDDALAAAGIGGGLGDLFCGGAEWIPFTVVIKMLSALCFTSKGDKMLSRRNIFAPIFVLLITVGGYYIAEALIFSNFTTVVSVLAGIFIMGDSFTLIQLLGIVIITAGVFGVSWQKEGGN